MLTACYMRNCVATHESAQYFASPTVIQPSRTVNTIGVARGFRGCRCIPPGRRKNFCGRFCEMRQNWAEFGDVHPRRSDKKVVGCSIWRIIWRCKRGWRLKKAIRLLARKNAPQTKSWLRLRWILKHSIGSYYGKYYWLYSSARSKYQSEIIRWICNLLTTERRVKSL